MGNAGVRRPGLHEAVPARTSERRFLLTGTFGLVIWALCLAGARAATITVNHTGDPEGYNTNVTVASVGTVVTLRKAVIAANNTPGDDIIVFDPSLAGKTIRLLQTGDETFGPSALAIRAGERLTLQGLSGIGNAVTIERDPAAGNIRLFYVPRTATLALREMTLRGGRSEGESSGGWPSIGHPRVSGGAGAGMGGAIVNAGELELDRVALVENTAQGGGVSGNRAVSVPWMSGYAPSGHGFNPPGVLDDHISTTTHNSGLRYPAGTVIIRRRVRWDGSVGYPTMILGGGLKRGVNVTLNEPIRFGHGGGSGMLRGLTKPVSYSFDLTSPFGDTWTLQEFNVIYGDGPGDDGGFGGGGGGSYSRGGNGGFGGGGGISRNGQHGVGGFGGGTPTLIVNPVINGRYLEGYSSPAPGLGAGMGGAIFNYGGAIRMTNSTFARNRAAGGIGSYSASGSSYGGGVFNLNGSVYAIYCTMAQNSAQNGGGIYSLGDNGIATQDGPPLPSTPATVRLVNSILANNDGSNDFAQSVYASDGVNRGTVSSSGPYNIIRVPATGTNAFAGNALNVDPMLDEYVFGPGIIPAFSPKPGSPAFGAATFVPGLNTDQARNPRSSTPAAGSMEANPLTFLSNPTYMSISDTNRDLTLFTRPQPTNGVFVWGSEHMTDGRFDARRAGVGRHVVACVSVRTNRNGTVTTAQGQVEVLVSDSRLPLVTSSPPTGIGGWQGDDLQATLHGEVFSDSGAPIVRRGFLISTSADAFRYWDYWEWTRFGESSRGGHVVELSTPGVRILEDPLQQLGVISRRVAGLESRRRYAYVAFAETSRGIAYSSIQFLTPALAPVTVVTTLDDENDGSTDPLRGSGTSLREAVAAANQAQADRLISFSPVLFAGGAATLALTRGEMVLNNAGTTTIAGPDAGQLTLSGGNASRIFRIDGGSVALHGLTLAHGHSDDEGGAVAVEAPAKLTVAQCVFATNNTSLNGGAIAVEGSAEIRESAFLGNAAPNGFFGNGRGGAIFNRGVVTVVNSTFYQNSAASFGGGFANHPGVGWSQIRFATFAGNSAGNAGGALDATHGPGGSFTLWNSIVSGNSSPALFAREVVGAPDEDGLASNLIGADPATVFATGIPEDNGGPTPNLIPRPNGPTDDAGDNRYAVDGVGDLVTTDQRGWPRVGVVDIGAVERSGTLPGINAGTALFVAGVPGEFVIPMAGTPAPKLTFTGALPAGMTLSPSGVLKGRPAVNAVGFYNLQLRANNNTGSEATREFSIVVAAPAQIAFTSVAGTTFFSGSGNSFPITATGNPAPTVTVDEALPDGVSLGADGLLTGTPTTTGTYPLTLRARNGVGADVTQAFTLTVVAPSGPAAPAFASAAGATFFVEQLGSFGLAATGYPAPSFRHEGDLPAGVEMTAAGVLRGTPSADAVGSYAVTLVASNGVAPEAGQSFLLRVSHAVPPDFTSTNRAKFVAGSNSTFAVTTSATPAPVFSVLGTLPAGLTLSPDGILSGTPPVEEIGFHRFILRARNGSLVADQLFTLAVTTASGGVPPAFTSATSALFFVNSTNVFAVTAEGFPDPTVRILSALPAGLHFGTDGRLEGTPEEGSSGSYPLELEAINGVLPAARQAFTLMIRETGLNVTTVNDEDDGNPDPNLGAGTSLREALAYAVGKGGAQTISMDPSLAGATLRLAIVGDNTFGPTALRIPTGSYITIEGLIGAGGGMTITRDSVAAPDRLRLFYVEAGGELTLNNLTLSGGLAQGGRNNAGGGGAGLGGAIVNAGTLNVLNSLLTGNRASGGSSFHTNGLIRSSGSGAGVSGDPGTAGPLFISGPGPGPNTEFGAGGVFHQEALERVWANNGGFGGGGSVGGNGGFGGGAGSAYPSIPGRGFAGLPAGIPGFGGGAADDSGFIISNLGMGGGGAGLGGAIFNHGGFVNLRNSTLAGNTAEGGAGQTPSANGSGHGGAIFNLNGTIDARFSTLAANAAPQGGGAIYNLGDRGVATQRGPALADSRAFVTLEASILADSVDGVPDYVQGTNASGGAGFGSVGSGGDHNIIETRSAGEADFEGNALTADPRLQSLADNGGPTRTRALASDSPAIRVSRFVPEGVTDQRGMSRSTNRPADAGAYQLTGLLPQLQVTTVEDEDDGNADPYLGTGTSLREALAHAVSLGGSQTITFASGLSSSGSALILLTRGELVLTNDIRIEGPGATNLSISGAESNRVFRIAAGGTATLSGLTVTGGRVDQGSLEGGAGAGVFNEGSLSITDCILIGNRSGGTQRGDGAAIYHHGVTLVMNRCNVSENTTAGGGLGAGLAADSGTVRISGSAFGDNRATDGGAIANLGATMFITNSTFANNLARDGGAILHRTNTLTLVHCTLSANTATNSGGGILHVGCAGSDVTLVNTLVAANAAANPGVDVSSVADIADGAFTSLGGNLIGIGEGSLGFTAGVLGDLVGSFGAPVFPGLGAYGDNGGPTPTMALLDSSPAINAAGIGSGVGTDQRGGPRGSQPDIGAFEAGLIAPAITSTNYAGFILGRSNGFAFTRTGFPLPGIVVSGALPPGVTLGNNGVLSGTPEPGTYGYFPLTVQATNGVPPDATQAFTLAVTTPSGQIPPVFTSANAANFAAGASNGFLVTAVGLPAPTFGLSGALPPGVTLSASGLLGGTPSADAYGRYPLVLRAMNAVAPGATQQFALTVTAPPGTLVVTTVDDENNGNPNPLLGTGTSLREALAQAVALGGSRTITFDPALAGQTLWLRQTGDTSFGPTSFGIPSGSQITIRGLHGDADGGITIARDEASATNGLRLFYVAPGGELTLDRLTVTGGWAQGGGSSSGGGGAGLGGAVLNAGTLRIHRSLVTTNRAVGGAGGISGSFNGGGVHGENTEPFAAATPPLPATAFGMGGRFAFRTPPQFGLLTSGGGFGGGGSAGGKGGFGGGGGSGLPSDPELQPGAAGFGGGPGSPSVPLEGGASSPRPGAGAGLGGAIFNHGGVVEIVNATFTANLALGGVKEPPAPANDGSGLGGAVFNLNGSVAIIASTLDGNTAAQGGGAIYSLGDNGVATQAGPALPSATATVTLANSILAGSGGGVADFIQNTNASDGVNFGAVSSVGTNNLIQVPAAGANAFGGEAQNVDPLLQALAFHGGPTRTRAIGLDSPALNAGGMVTGLATDQRGQVRVVGPAPDIGAFEFLNAPPMVAADTLERPNTTRVAKVLLSVLMGNDADADGDPLEVHTLGDPQPPGATIQVVGRFALYTAPATNSGHGSFTYTLGDGLFTRSGTVSVIETADGAPVASAPNAAQMTLSGADMHVRFLGLPGRRYGVQYATDTTPPYTWREFPVPVDLVAPASGVLTFTDVDPVDPVRLYRVILRR